MIGAFFGGRTSIFLSIAERCSEAIDDDLKRGIVAVWHDESHLNRYYCDHPPDLVLPPNYCYPEASGLPYEAKLMVMNKDHELIRTSGWRAAIIRCRRFGRRLLRGSDQVRSAKVV
jgi:hypothetical protein